MTAAATVGALTLDAVVIAALGWTTWTALRSREQPSAGPFIAVVGALTLWALLETGSEVTGALPTAALSTVWGLGQFGTAIAVPGAWTVYALGYTGRGTGLTRRRLLMLAGIALPVLGSALTIALAVTREVPEPVVEAVVAGFLGTEFLYLLVLFLYATYLLVGLGGSHARVSNTQIAVLTGGVVAPYLAGAAGDGGVADGTTVGLLVSGGLLAFAVRRYPVLTGFPKADYVARSRVVETLQEAVVVLDWDDHVLDCNEAATRLFGRSSTAIVGEPVRSVIDGLDEQDLAVGATETVTLRTSGGRRQFQFSVSAVDEGDGDESGSDPVARTVLFRDVTDRQTREQRLTVLNRILRHNVRNELDIVLAHADHVEDETLRSGIRESATNLLELGETAREAEEVMTASTESPETVDLAAAARAVAEEYHTLDDAEIAVDCPAELPVSSHRTVVRAVLAELVENAVEHGDDAVTHVEITVREGTDAAAEIAVADDGPGIPERERQVLAEGTETQLEHGRGIGLWFVNWAVTQLGGDLDFRENDPEGSVVTVRLYPVEYAS
jgi:PAS domain S-box-containing protein